MKTPVLTPPGVQLPKPTGLSRAASRAVAADRFCNRRRRNVGAGVLVICAFTALIGVFAISAGRAGQNTPRLTCLPIVPREGQPLILRLTLRNIGLHDEDYTFAIHVNGEVVAEGRALIPAQSSKDISYVSPVDIPVGQSLRIYAEAQGSGSTERYEEHVQIPPCPPEIWSSFSSFSSFATSFSFYTSFAVEGLILGPLNVGAVLTMALLGVLVFLQVSDPSWRTLGLKTLSLRTRYGWLAVVLLAIFAAMVFTRIILIITHLG